MKQLENIHFLEDVQTQSTEFVSELIILKDNIVFDLNYNFYKHYVITKSNLLDITKPNCRLTAEQ